MSRTEATAKFPDGTVKYGIHDGTSDTFAKHLFDTPEKAWEYWGKLRAAGFDDSEWDTRKPAQLQIYDIELQNYYGSGHTYRTKATKYAIEGSLDVDDLQEISK